MANVADTFLSRAVGDIAADLPGATAVFRRFDLDYCSQGHVILADAILRRGLDTGDVIAALKALDPEAAPKAPRETGALIKFIKTRYHDQHRRQISELIDLSGKVEIAHVNHPQVPAGLALTLQQFQTELEALMQEQETVHFPALQEKTPQQLALTIRVMRHDHAEYAFFLDQVIQITDNCTLPADACASWQTLYARVRQFKDDLMEHIHLENNILFPRFEAMSNA